MLFKITIMFLLNQLFLAANIPLRTMCNQCALKPVYVTLNHQKLCKQCYIQYFEKKVFKTLRSYKLIEDTDIIVCGLSGGKDSITTAYLLQKYLAKSRRNVLALLIDEGIKGYRSKTLRDAEEFCKEHAIPLTVVSYIQEFGISLDNLLKKSNKKPCTPCGILRRYMLNKYARKLKATKLAVGHNLDD